MEDLEKALEAHGTNVAGFLVEPIQGEAGVNVPDDDYLKNVCICIFDYIYAGCIYVRTRMYVHMCKTKCIKVCVNVWHGCIVDDAYIYECVYVCMYIIYMYI